MKNSTFIAYTCCDMDKPTIPLHNYNIKSTLESYFHIITSLRLL